MMVAAMMVVAMMVAAMMVAAAIRTSPFARAMCPVGSAAGAGSTLRGRDHGVGALATAAAVTVVAGSAAGNASGVDVETTAGMATAMAMDIAPDVDRARRGDARALVTARIRAVGGGVEGESCSLGKPTPPSSLSSPTPRLPPHRPLRPAWASSNLAELLGELSGARRQPHQLLAPRTKLRSEGLQAPLQVLSFPL